MTKLISLVLSFSIIFMSVAPSYAQGVEAVRSEREAMAQFEESFERAAADAQRGQEVVEGMSEEDIEGLIEVLALMEGVSANEYKARLEKELVKQWGEQANVVIRWNHAEDFYEGYLGEDFLNKCRSMAEGKVAKRERSVFEETLKFNIGKLSRDPIYINHGVYLQKCLDVYLSETGTSLGAGDAYYSASLLSGKASKVAYYVKRHGASEEGFGKVFSYLSKVINWGGLGEGIDSRNQFNEASARMAVAGHALEALGVLGVMYKEAHGKEVVDAVYNFVLKHHREQVMSGLVYQGLMVLLGVDSGYAREKIKDFIVYQAERTVGGVLVDGLSYLSVEGLVEGISKAGAKQEGYLNQYTARYQYLDKDFYEVGGFKSGWENAVAQIEHEHQYPWGNLLEEFGKALAYDAVKNKATRQMLDGIDFDKVSRPLVTGILVGGEIEDAEGRKQGVAGWYAYNRYGDQLAEVYLKGLLGTTFTDLNEGSERRIRYQAAKALVAHGYYGGHSNKSAMLTHYSKVDESKKTMYAQMQFIKGVALGADIGLIVWFLPGIVKGLATLGLKGVKLIGTVTHLRSISGVAVRGLAKVSRWQTLPLFLGGAVKGEGRLIKVKDSFSRIKHLTKAERKAFGKILSKEIGALRVAGRGKVLTTAQMEKAYANAWQVFKGAGRVEKGQMAAQAGVKSAEVRAGVEPLLGEVIPVKVTAAVPVEGIKTGQIARLGEGSVKVRMTAEQAKAVLNNLRRSVAQKPWHRKEIQALYKENIKVAKELAKQTGRRIDVVDIAEAYRSAYQAVVNPAVKGGVVAGGNVAKVTAPVVKQVEAVVDGGRALKVSVPVNPTVSKPAGLGRVAMDAMKWNWNMFWQPATFKPLKDLKFLATTRKGLATLMLSGALTFSPAPMLSSIGNAGARATTAIEMVMQGARSADVVTDFVQVGTKVMPSLQSVRAVNAAQMMSTVNQSRGVLGQLGQVGGLVSPTVGMPLMMGLPVRWRAGQRSGLFDSYRSADMMGISDVAAIYNQAQSVYNQQVQQYVLSQSERVWNLRDVEGMHAQYDFWKLQDRKAAFNLGQEATKWYWTQAGYPVVGAIQNGVRSLTEGTYLYGITPLTFASNFYYSGYQTQLNEASAAAEAASVTATSAAGTSSLLDFAPISLNEASAETPSASQTFFSWANRILGRQTDPLLVKIEKEIRQTLLAPLAGAYSFGIVYRNPLIDRLQANQTASRYTKETEGILLEARRQAVQEYISIYGDELDFLNKDKNFINIYQQKIQDGLENSSLPSNIRTIVLNNVAVSLQNSKVLQVPVYNKQNHLIGTVAVERPAGMNVKENQSYYIVYNAEDKTGSMHLWEPESSGSSTGKQTEIRTDIPLEIVNRQVKTTPFGLKKVAEGLLMINNRVWPMFGLYLLAGMGNVTTVISTFAKESFALSNMEMYLMGGVSSVAMGIVSLFAGVWQNKWSFTEKGYNERRGRLITTNIGLISAMLAFALPWLVGGMGGVLGTPFMYKKYLLISSFLLLGISGAFLDVSMKPTLMAVSHRGDYQARLGTLSVFKQTIGNVSNYVLPPIAMAIAMAIGTRWDWTVFFPVYTVGSIVIAGLYNFFKMNEQTLADKEVSSPKEVLSLKTMFKELAGKEQYNKLIRYGVLATAFHGANMSIFGIYVNNLMKSHYPDFNLTALYGDGVASAGQMIEIMTSSWLGYSMLYFTIPIIVGRILGTRLMKQDNSFLGIIPIKKMNGGNLLKLSIGAVALAIALINMPVWSLQVAGVVILALGLTNVSPIIGGYTTDRTRHVSDAVSALLSGSSLLSFGVSTAFGYALDMFAASSPIYAWIPFIIPFVMSAYLFGFGVAMSRGTLEKKAAAAPAQTAKAPEPTLAEKVTTAEKTKATKPLKTHRQYQRKATKVKKIKK